MTMHATSPIGLRQRFAAAASAFFARWTGTSFVCRRVRGGGARVRGGAVSALPPREVAQVLGMSVVPGNAPLQAGEVYRCLPDPTWTRYRAHSKADPFTLAASERELEALATHIARLRARVTTSGSAHDVLSEVMSN